MTKTTGQRIVEKWRTRHHGPGAVGHHDVELQIDIDQALETANAEVTRLREALNVYGDHDRECGVNAGTPCTCGLDKAISLKVGADA